MTNPPSARQSIAMSNKNEPRFTEEDIVDVIEQGSRQPRKETCPESDALSTGNNLAMLVRLVERDAAIQDEEISSLYDKIMAYKEWSDTYIKLRLEHYCKTIKDKVDET